MTKEIKAGPTGRRRRMPVWLRGILIAFGALILMPGGLATLPLVWPSGSAAVADELRTLLGPQFVAELESASFQIQDFVNQLRYRAGGMQPQVSWATSDQNPSGAAAAPDNAVNPAGPTPDANGGYSGSTPAPDSSADADPGLDGHRHPGANSPGPALPTPTPVPALPLPALQPITAWESFGPSSQSQSILARASVQPDLYRPYAQVALVRIDLTKTTLHVVPGTVEPIAASGVAPFSRPGIIPPSEQTGSLVAAFNGGFKAINGHYGMMADGATIIPPSNGLATVAMYRDGSVRIGEWGRDLMLTPDMLAYRQNCPLLIDAGVLNPSIRDENRREWGFTVKNLDTTWRSGIGLTRDGHYLIYAVGYSVTVESLSVALQAAGAYYAMQLDINGFYTRFVTYRTVGKSLVADKLLVQMTSSASQFLTPYERDFFFALARS